MAGPGKLNGAGGSPSASGMGGARKRAATARLKAECRDFNAHARRVCIAVYLDGVEVGTLAVARRHAAEIMRLINGLQVETVSG